MKSEKDFQLNCN